MIDTAILLLTETKIPRDLTFNSCGVCQKVLCAKGELKKGYLNGKGRWEIHIICINGIWYGSSHCDYHLGGYGGPVTKTHPFTTAEYCIEYYYRQVERYLLNNGCEKIPTMPALSQFEEQLPYDT